MAYSIVFYGLDGRTREIFAPNIEGRFGAEDVRKWGRRKRVREGRGEREGLKQAYQKF